MKLVATALASLALLASPQPALAATTTGSDYSDLWWNAAESGWGAHVTQQGDILFAVLFVYDSEHRPRFFVASSMARIAAASGEAFEGTLYSTSGPAFGAAFDPARVTARAVGTATLRFDAAGSGTLSYTVDGVPVTKAITRQVWRPIELQGEFKGGLFANATADTCRLATSTIAYPGTVRVTRSGDQATIDLDFTPTFADTGACRMTGKWTQQGSLATITQGTYTCTFENGPTPVAGTFELTAIESDENGFAGRYSARQDGSCIHTGRLGGFRARLAPPEPPPE